MQVVIQINKSVSRPPSLREIWPEERRITPGQTVLIKPNLVLDRHPRGNDVRCLVARGEVLRQVLDRVATDLQGTGRIMVGDSPLQTTSFEGALEASGIGKAIKDFERDTGHAVELIDFRQVHADRDERGHIRSWKEVPGDPHGYVTYDLDGHSVLCPHEADSHKFRVSNYQAEDTMQYHGRNKHRYVIAKSVIDADTIISLPKMKTHCKVGVTLSMKNFVGTVGRKQCLAHHREGGAPGGGDEYPDKSQLKAISVWLENAIDGNPQPALRKIYKLAYRINERLIKTLGINPIRDGGWYGNDTCWRMTLDLVRIAIYGRQDGTLSDTPQRNIWTIVDGLIAGEGEGPLEATPVEANALVFGDNPLMTDIFTAALMGFDYRKIPLLREATEIRTWPIWDAGCEMRDTGYGIRDAEVGGQRSEVGGQRSEVGGRKTVVGGRRSEGGSMLDIHSTCMVNGVAMTLEELAGSDVAMRFEAPMGWKGTMEWDA